MNCYDCARESADNPAVAVCNDMFSRALPQTLDRDRPPDYRNETVESSGNCP
jgi:hypothetical protein